MQPHAFAQGGGQGEICQRPFIEIAGEVAIQRVPLLRFVQCEGNQCVPEEVHGAVLLFDMKAQFAFVALCFFQDHLFDVGTATDVDAVEYLPHQGCFRQQLQRPCGCFAAGR